MTAALVTYLSVIALSLSAVAWVIAAVAAPVITASYFDNLPPKVIRRQRIAGWANIAAALLAAAGVAFQAYASAQAL